MNRHSFQDRIIFFYLEPVGCIFFALGGDVARCTRHSTVFMLCTLEDHLHPLIFCFFSHFLRSPINFGVQKYETSFKYQRFYCNYFI